LQPETGLQCEIRRDIQPLNRTPQIPQAGIRPVPVYRVSGARSDATGSRTGPAAVQPVEMISIRAKVA